MPLIINALRGGHTNTFGSQDFWSSPNSDFSRNKFRMGKNKCNFANLERGKTISREEPSAPLTLPP